VIELTADGTDYLSHGDLDEDEYAASFRELRRLLEAAGQPLTLREVLERWLPGARAPNDVTLWRWLERGVGEGLLRQTGTGRRNDPFRFGLAVPD
jgi:hypothetical protein